MDGKVKEIPRQYIHVMHYVQQFPEIRLDS